MNKKEAIKILKDGGIGILPTDTLYGIVGSVFSKETIERIYKVKKRDKKKPFIILISNIEKLKEFDINLNKEIRDKILKLWEEKSTSIIFDCKNEKFNYLHRGLKSLAIRLPKNEDLKSFLKETGSLVAPSANLESFPPAKNIKEAKEYFGNKIDFYINGGELDGKASRLLRINDSGEVEILR